MVPRTRRPRSDTHLASDAYELSSDASGGSLGALRLAPRWHTLGVLQSLSRSVRGRAGRYASSRRSAAAEPRDAADLQQPSRLAAPWPTRSLARRSPASRYQRCSRSPSSPWSLVRSGRHGRHVLRGAHGVPALSLAGQGAAVASDPQFLAMLTLAVGADADGAARRASAAGGDDEPSARRRRSRWIADAVGLWRRSLAGLAALLLKLVLPANAPALAPAARYLRYRARLPARAPLLDSAWQAFRGAARHRHAARLAVLQRPERGLGPYTNGRVQARRRRRGARRQPSRSRWAAPPCTSASCRSASAGGNYCRPAGEKPPARATVKALAAGAAAIPSTADRAERRVRRGSSDRPKQWIVTSRPRPTPSRSSTGCWRASRSSPCNRRRRRSCRRRSEKGTC